MKQTIVVLLMLFAQESGAQHMVPPQDVLIEQVPHEEFMDAEELTISDLPEDFPNLRFTIDPFYYSIGVKLGHVLSVRRERPVISTYEGEMMLGFGSGPESVTDRLCGQTLMQSLRRNATPDERKAVTDRIPTDCFLFVNPWPFSFLSTSLFDSLVEIKDKPVVIYYVNYYWAPSHVIMRTTNQVLRVFQTDPDLTIEKSYQLSTWARVLPLAGYITGRVVQASVEFPIRKSYEIIIQESENANNFTAMSISSRAMFRYLTHAMLTGKQMRLGYVRLYRPHGALLSLLFNYRTNYRVISAELQD